MKSPKKQCLSLKFDGIMIAIKTEGVLLMKKISGFYRMLLAIAISSLCISLIMHMLCGYANIASILIAAFLLFWNIAGIYMCIKAAIIQHIDLKNRQKEREKLRRYEENKKL